MVGMGCLCARERCGGASMNMPIQFANVPSRPMKPARKRALLLWLAASLIALGSAALMVLYAP